MPGKLTLSLQARLLIAATIVLAGFLGLTGLVLDKAFRDNAEAAVRERLQSHVYALLAAAELDAHSMLQLPQDLPEPRFGIVNSGLYAEVRRADGSAHWRSKSALGIEIPANDPVQTGEWRFRQTTSAPGLALFALEFGVAWEDANRRPQRYIVRVAESLDAFYGQVRRFRGSLWGWLGAVTLLLLAVQGGILRWGLTPLRRVAEDLRAIENGSAERLTGRYPKELRGLTDNLNTLIGNARAHLERYRDTLGNLAHSLKTPLAVLRAAMESKSSDSDLRRITGEQIDRMSQIVEYQLQRAAVSGRATLSGPIRVAPPARKIVAALAKVYGEKAVECKLHVENDAVFYGDEGDLMEVLGNLADNAFKWCRSRVELSARTDVDANRAQSRLVLRIEDDGPGIAEEFTDHVLQRGERADQTIAGHGIGLAMVQDIVRLYGGRLNIARGALGGAAVEIRI